MTQAVSHRPLTMETQIPTRVIACGICGDQSGTGVGFSPTSSVFLSLSFLHAGLAQAV
jgi:hypothetical protein